MGLRLGVAVALAATLAGVLASGALSLGQGKAPLLLPDLDLLAPAKISVVSEGFGSDRRYVLGFSSAAYNAGDGPLEILGRRKNTRKNKMVAVQHIYRVNGSKRVARGAGRLGYVVDPTHQHWHLLPFMKYELRKIRRTPGERLRRVVRRDEKTGFCLGDRSQLDNNARGGAKPARAVYAHNCGFDKPGMLWMKEGISVGWVDTYDPIRDGQQIDLTGLPAGLYRLIHRVNPDGLIREKTMANNMSSAVVQIKWPNGRNAAPQVTVLKTCEDTPSCKLTRS